ncbi:MAG: radical SAM protein [Endomicrobiia bacterium]
MSKDHSFQEYKYVYKQTKKELHGWYVGKDCRRECTSERLLINPYNGCSVGCFYCYTRALPGYFEEFHKENKIFVFKNFAEVVEEQISQLYIASCGYLSPTTDPFQKIEEKENLSRKIIEIFLKYNIPIEFITKCKIPQEIIEILKPNYNEDKNSCKKHCFGQVSILTVNEDLRKILSPNGANVNELFYNLLLLSKNNIFAVCRIDPILPYINDKKEHLKEILLRAKDCGVKHVIASVLDIPIRIYNFVLEKIKRYFGTSIYYEYKNLYIEKVGYINAKLDYRLRIFDYLRNFCDKYGLTFALCMEYKIINNKKNSFYYEGLNKTFMSSTNCEGVDIPIYIRKPTEKKFYPAAECLGKCLSCSQPLCGIETLAQGKSLPKGFKLKDYKNFSKLVEQKFEYSLFK